MANVIPRGHPRIVPVKNTGIGYADLSVCWPFPVAYLLLRGVKNQLLFLNVRPNLPLVGCEVVPEWIRQSCELEIRVSASLSVDG